MVNPQVMQQLPNLMTAQQKQEQFQAMQQKLVLKSTLTDTCDKHPGNVIIFEKPNLEKEGEVTKVCEKCFFEIQEKAAAANPSLTSTDSTNQESQASAGKSVTQLGEEQKSIPEINKQ